MANHRSAQKRARQTVKRTVRGTHRRSRVKTAIRTFLSAMESGEEKTAAKLNTATAELRKAASKGILHRRNASRRVSRLVRKANAAQATS